MNRISTLLNVTYVMSWPSMFITDVKFVALKCSNKQLIMNKNVAIFQFLLKTRFTLTYL